MGMGARTTATMTTAANHDPTNKGGHHMKAPHQQLRCFVLFAAFILAVLPHASRAQSPSPDSAGEGVGPVNVMCPVITDEPVDPRFTTEYDGVTVGLCCRKCLTKFEADPTAYINDIAEFSTVGLDDHTAHVNASRLDDQHADHDHDPPAEEGTSHQESEGHQHREDSSMSSSTSQDNGHDHATDHDSGPKLTTWIGKLHQPATHLPIGLLIGAAIAEIGMIFTRKEWFRHAAGFCLALGTLGALGAATLGWFNGGVALWDSDWVQATHRWLGTGTAALSLVTLVFYLQMSRAKSGSPPAFWYRASLFFTTSLVGAAGFFGGALVYGISHYAW